MNTTTTLTTPQRFRAGFSGSQAQTNKKRTIKERLRTDTLQSNLTLATVPFLQRHYPGEVAAQLPVLVNYFTRSTLVGNDRPERITLDFDTGQLQTHAPAGAENHARHNS